MSGLSTDGKLSDLKATSPVSGCTADRPEGPGLAAVREVEHRAVDRGVAKQVVGQMDREDVSHALRVEAVDLGFNRLLGDTATGR